MFRPIGIISRDAADIELVDLDNTVELVLTGQYQAPGMTDPPAVGWLTPTASGSRIDDIPLSDCRIAQCAAGDNFVACNGVWVVTYWG
jgi:hypothetical protein